jgi:hypothetical protein
VLKVLANVGTPSIEGKPTVYLGLHAKRFSPCFISYSSGIFSIR